MPIFWMSASISSTSNSHSRLDINKIPEDQLTPIRPDRIWSHQINRQAKKLLQPIREMNEQKTHGLLKLNQHIHITIFLLLTPGIGPKEAKPGHFVRRLELRPVLINNPL